MCIIKIWHRPKNFHFYPLRTPFFSLSQYNLRKVFIMFFDMKNDECFEQLKLNFVTVDLILKICQFFVWLKIFLNLESFV